MTDTWDAMSDWAMYNYQEAELKYAYKEKELTAAQEMAGMSMMASESTQKSQLEAMGIAGEQEAVRLQSAEKQSGIWSNVVTFAMSTAGQIVIVVALIGAIAGIVAAVSGIFGKRKRKQKVK